MSNKSKISILGLYKYDKHIFDKFNYPTAWNSDEQITFVYALLMECAELEVLFTDADFMGEALAVWSAKERPIWDKLYNTTTLKYNPIWNKDGTVTETRTLKGSHALTNAENNNVTSTKNATNHGESATNGSAKNSGNEDTSGNSASQSNGAVNQTDLHSVWGFNGGSDSDADKNVGTTSNTNSESGSNSQHTTNSGSESHEESNTTDSKYEDNGTETGHKDGSENGSHEETETYTRIEQGNIGVTTTQSMIVEEREVAKFNLTDYIIDSFKKRFCILVY